MTVLKIIWHNLHSAERRERERERESACSYVCAVLHPHRLASQLKTYMFLLLCAHMGSVEIKSRKNETKQKINNPKPVNYTILAFMLKYCFVMLGTIIAEKDWLVSHR